MRENLTKPKIGRKSTSKEEKAKRKKTQQKIRELSREISQISTAKE